MCRTAGDASSNATDSNAKRKFASSRRYHQAPQRLEDDYVISSQVLGNGCNGDVLVASCKTDPERSFAVKSVRIPKDKESFDQLMQEVEIYLSMDHPHIAQLFGVYETKDRICFVMECLQGGDLFEHIERRLDDKNTFSEVDARAILHQILLVLNYMHSHGFVHRDVKPENLVYDRKGSDHLKLIDFGFSEKWDQSSKATMSIPAGTLHYMAPEVLEQSYTSQCDLWSLGVVGFILLFGYMPFSGREMRMIENIKHGAFVIKPAVGKLVSDDAKDFIQSLLAVEPSKRLTAKGALEHPWVERDRKEPPSGIADALTALRDFGCISKFRRACLRMLASVLPNEGHIKMRDHFLWLADRNEGVITMERLSQIMSHQFGGVGADQALQVFQAFGYEENKELQYCDFLAAMSDTRSGICVNENVLRFAFDRFDQEAHGYIYPRDLCIAVGYEDGLDSSMQSTFQCSSNICSNDFVTLFLDTSCRCADIVQRRRITTTLKNAFEAWKDRKRVEVSVVEQPNEGTEQPVAGSKNNVESTCEKHGLLVGQFLAVRALIEGTSKFNFELLKKHAAIRREMCQLGL